MINLINLKYNLVFISNDIFNELGSMSRDTEIILVQTAIEPFSKSLSISSEIVFR